MNTSNLPKSVRALIADIKVTAKANGIDLYFGKGKSIRIENKGKVGGYFCEEGALAVATGIPQYKWLEILIHESCHMDQWLENSRYWNDELDSDIHTFDRYICGSNEPNIERAVDNIVMMEADCERRAVAKIEQYNLPLNTKTYSKRANAYLLSHKAMVHYQSWYKVGPYKHRCTWVPLPDTLSVPSAYKIKNNKIDPTFFCKCF